jgi:hypothetical protein
VNNNALNISETNNKSKLCIYHPARITVGKGGFLKASGCAVGAHPPTV